MFLQNLHLKQQFAVGFVQVAPLLAPPLVYILHDAVYISTSVFITNTNATLQASSIKSALK